ncbi:hypothetical protein [Flavobacterium caeni]|uniref:Uncharacterized protein n=1 Tax=Flavobacterium caeni TaxID=490189 RepID=A0A1G5D0B1_9FLAO|nr:hypothetical protein [Flavobacterium caeni]SCY08104.1 hypothetical protein SAMN02927903_00700 [Flavobacterium caeni]
MKKHTFSRRVAIGSVTIAGLILFLWMSFSPTIVRSPGKCNDVFFVNLDDASSAYPNWVVENEKYFVESTTPTPPIPSPSPRPTSNPFPSCSTNHARLDLNKMYNDPLLNLAGWLKLYGKYICFDRSAQFIECEHLFGETEQDNLEAAWVRATITVADIRKAFTDEQRDLNVERYEWYLKISFKWHEYGVNLKAVDKFYPGDNCFSAAFINSIITNRNLKDTDEIQIKRPKVKRPDGTSARTMVLSVKDDLERHYYNFSQVPQSAARSDYYSPL